jgi:hypothetical protein
MLLAIALQGVRSGHWASIALSTTNPNTWQLTWHDDAGPLGHTCRGQIGEAIAEALRDGYTFHRARGECAEIAGDLVTFEQQRLDALRLYDWESEP